MIEISKFSSNDVMDVYKLEKECFSDPWSTNMLLDCVNNDRYAICVAKDGVTVGYAGVVFCGDTADVTRIAVTKEYRKQGIGQKLFNHLLDYSFSNGARSIFLEVRTDNAPAISLYEKAGGKKFGTRKNYYGSGIDADLYSFTKGD